MTYLLFVLVIIVPIIAIFAYRQGLKDCQSIKMDIPLEKEEAEEYEPDKDELIAEMIRKNIENYQGSERGQIDIESGGNI